MSSAVVGFTAMAIGVVAIIISLLSLVEVISTNQMILLAGSFVFGCGTIATAIGLKK